MPIITIDGNIGSGKTSVLNYLHKYNKLSIDLEPIENWQKYINNIYSKNKRDIFNFQVRVWLDRCWIQEKQDKSLILMERSPYFIKNTFIKMFYENNSISENEFNILNNLYNKTDNIWSCYGYIYLQSNPEKCLERINKRNRQGEDDITLDYVTSLHNLHENAVNNKTNIIIINVENKDISEIANEIYNSQMIKKVLFKTI